MRCGGFQSLLGVLKNSFRAWQDGHSAFRHRGAGMLFQAHGARDAGLGPMNLISDVSHTSAKSAFSLKKP